MVIDRRCNLDNGTIVAYACSVEHPEVPVLPDAVRAQVLYNVTKFEPITSPTGAVHTKVTMLLVSDPCGSLPAFIVKQCNVRGPLCIAHIRKLIKQDHSVLEQAQAEEVGYQRSLVR